MVTSAYKRGTKTKKKKEEARRKKRGIQKQDTSGNEMLSGFISNEDAYKAFPDPMLLSPQPFFLPAGGPMGYMNPVQQTYMQYAAIVAQQQQ